MNKLKIAYLLPGTTISGGVGVVLQHANRLQKRGHELYITALNGNTSADWFPGQKVSILKMDDLPDDLDILVATHWSTSYEIVNMKAKHKCYFVQSDETRFHEKGSDIFYMTQLSYLFNFHYLTEAKWIQKWLIDNFDKKAALVPNGLDSDIFHRTKPIEKKGRKLRVLLEGPINAPLKGMKEAFEVVKDLDVEVWCISSDGKPSPEWKCHRFFESVPMAKMKEIYSSCDILLKLSRMEGFFGPPLEMMACGGTCVVGNVTGHDEYIIDGENALVVDPMDIEGAGQAVQKLIDNKELREKLRVNGEKTAQQWNWDKFIDVLENYYHEISAGEQRETISTREMTNMALIQFKRLSPETSLLPHEKLARIIESNKVFKTFADRVYSLYTKFS